VDRFGGAHVAHERVGQPRNLGVAEDLVDARPAEVAIDEQHALTLLREGDGQVGGGRALPLARAGAGDDDLAHGLDRRREEQVGPQGAERLGGL
jgi:hypothetical protein